MGNAAAQDRTCADCGASSTGFRCATCRGKRSRRERARALGVPVDEHYGDRRRLIEGPDPAPARRLRRELELRRSAGVSFGAAWTPSVAAALRVAGPGERREWEYVFARTMSAWRYSYIAVGPKLALSASMVDPDAGERAAALLVA